MNAEPARNRSRKAVDLATWQPGTEASGHVFVSLGTSHKIQKDVPGVYKPVDINRSFEVVNRRSQGISPSITCESTGRWCPLERKLQSSKFGVTTNTLVIKKWDFVLFCSMGGDTPISLLRRIYVSFFPFHWSQSLYP